MRLLVIYENKNYDFKLVIISETNHTCSHWVTLTHICHFFTGTFSTHYLHWFHLKPFQTMINLYMYHRDNQSPGVYTGFYQWSKCTLQGFDIFFVILGKISEEDPPPYPSYTLAHWPVIPILHEPGITSSSILRRYPFL